MSIYVCTYVNMARNFQVDHASSPGVVEEAIAIESGIGDSPSALSAPNLAMRHQISLVHMNALGLVVRSVEVASEERGAPEVAVERDHIHLSGHQPPHSQIVVPRVAVHLQCCGGHLVHNGHMVFAPPSFHHQQQRH